ncbi:hypothetical protein SLA2020_231730 [Shorea laevis]
MRFLDCSPREENGIPEPDQSDHFMIDPISFATNFVKNQYLPSHIVLFDSKEKQLGEFLELHSFKETGRFFQAHVKVDRGLQASVVVYARSG